MPRQGADEKDRLTLCWFWSLNGIRSQGEKYTPALPFKRIVTVGRLSFLWELNIKYTLKRRRYPPQFC